MLNINSLLYAHLIIFIIIIYILIPLLNKINPDSKGIKLFTNYYSDNKFHNIYIDFFIIYILLKLSDKLPLDIPLIFKRIIVILLFDVLLSMYINQTPYKIGNIHFLKEWSITVGWFAILWDIIYINSTGYIMDKINIKSDNLNLLIMGIIGFILLHN